MRLLLRVEGRLLQKASMGAWLCLSCAHLVRNNKYNQGLACMHRIHRLDTCTRSKAAEALTTNAESLPHQGASSLYYDAQDALPFF